ncbi:Protein polybromo-1 [Pleurostoma richardsiae]|uniref:Protein polybromo-1 n=1 Tax=Pleurostoma richardsiae TaxID=41990 RepID=A0AA38VXP1_9PEZI|nr:Protein polybromo-1 [Pleurostoma richardsiae]
MDHKRKANSNGAGAADAEDRAAKRRRLLQEEFDLFKGETPESTTQYGLYFLEQIRRTADKNRRLVAGYFEKLLPEKGNEDYYKKIRMPISLQTIERKLKNRDFANLSELESYFKRMVSNAKEFYPRSSPQYEDAERVRKALSNYMTKTNPAYKLIPGYSAAPTAIPAEPEPEPEPQVETEAEAEGDEDAEGEPDEDEDEDADADEDEDEDADADADGDDDAGPRRSRAVVARRGPGRPPKNALQASDTQYENVPYKGLSFQQAQEKIVEELIRRREEEDDWAYFEPFIFLPPRSLRDYYQLIQEPMSLRNLQKLVKGIHGRAVAKGSDFKSWSALEEKASLLWENAFYYNEEGSEISELARELKDAFYEQLEQAKEAVEEPPQPKIKLIASSAQESTKGRKKITIHVGGKNSATGSPVPPTAGSTGSAPPETTPNGAPSNNYTSAAGGSGTPMQLDKTRSVSASVAPPSPLTGVKREDGNRQSPAVPPQVNGTATNATGSPATGQVTQAPSSGLPNGQNQVVTNPSVLYDRLKYRLPGKGVADALIQNLCIRTHPTISYDKRFVFNLPPHPKHTQQSVAITLPNNHFRAQIIPKLSPALEMQQRPYKLFVIVNGTTLGRSIPVPQDPVEPGAMVYDAGLHHSVNTIMVQVCAALPKGQKLPNGADVELETVTVLANLPRY